MLFSVGAGGAPAPDDAVVAVVVVGVVVSGAFSSLAHAAVIAPIAMIAERPERTVSRRPKRRESMGKSNLCRDSGKALVKARAGERSSCCDGRREALSAPAAHIPAA
jgi:hypothetical protein